MAISETNHFSNAFKLQIRYLVTTSMSRMTDWLLAFLLSLNYLALFVRVQLLEIVVFNNGRFMIPICPPPASKMKYCMRLIGGRYPAIETRWTMFSLFSFSILAGQFFLELRLTF